MKIKFVVSSVLIVGVLLLVGSYLLGQSMGPQIATHWNAAGEADGYGTTFTGLYLIPLMTMVLAMLILFIPEIDPLKVNIATFRTEYNAFVLFFAGFMYYVHGLSLAWNLGLRFSMNAMLAPAFGLFFVWTGLLLLKAKRNYFIGIRTPWTLANDTVWEKTHQVGGRLFIASGILTVACVVYPSSTPFVLLVTAMGAALIAVVYSYLEFRRIEKDSVIK